MSRLVPSACAFCHPHDRARNEQTDELPSFDAFASVPDDIFTGHVRRA
jgi:hypothetical protein